MDAPHVIRYTPSDVPMRTLLLHEGAMSERRSPDRQITLDEAAARLEIEVAAARLFFRLKLLRPAASDPPTVWERDVERLRRVLLRQRYTSLQGDA